MYVLVSLSGLASELSCATGFVERYSAYVEFDLRNLPREILVDIVLTAEYTSESSAEWMVLY